MLIKGIVVILEAFAFQTDNGFRIKPHENQSDFHDFCRRRLDSGMRDIQRAKMARIQRFNIVGGQSPIALISLHLLRKDQKYRGGHAGLAIAVRAVDLLYERPAFETACCALWSQFKDNENRLAEGSFEDVSSLRNDLIKDVPGVGGPLHAGAGDSNGFADVHEYLLDKNVTLADCAAFAFVKEPQTLPLEIKLFLTPAADAANERDLFDRRCASDARRKFNDFANSQAWARQKTAPVKQKASKARLDSDNSTAASGQDSEKKKNMNYGDLPELLKQVKRDIECTEKKLDDLRKKERKIEEEINSVNGGEKMARVVSLPRAATVFIENPFYLIGAFLLFVAVAFTPILLLNTRMEFISSSAQGSCSVSDLIFYAESKSRDSLSKCSREIREIVAECTDKRYSTYSQQLEIGLARLESNNLEPKRITEDGDRYTPYDFISQSLNMMRGQCYDYDGYYQ